MSSRLTIGWLKRGFWVMGWLGAQISTALVTAAQGPEVQFKDITAQSHLDFTQY